MLIYLPRIFLPRGSASLLRRFRKVKSEPFPVKFPLINTAAIALAWNWRKMFETRHNRWHPAPAGTLPRNIRTLKQQPCQKSSVYTMFPFYPRGANHHLDAFSGIVPFVETRTRSFRWFLRPYWRDVACKQGQKQHREAVASSSSSVSGQGEWPKAWNISKNNYRG